jgi:hypothetical protein
MANLAVPKGIQDIVNLLETRQCCFCGSIFPKRKQMWKYPDGSYMCISCKTSLAGKTDKGESLPDG